MKKLPGYLLILCSVFLFLSAAFLIFSFVMIILYDLRDYGYLYLIRQGAIILIELVSAFLLQRLGRRMIRQNK